MKKTTFFAVLFYFLGLLSLCAYAFLEFYPRILFRPAGKIAVLLIFCFFTYLGSRTLSKSRSEKQLQIMKFSFWCCFAAYLTLLITFTLLEPDFYRTGTASTVFSDPVLLRYYLDNLLNLIPFRTILYYVGCFFQQSRPFSDIATNLLGNLAALMPMGLFLPLLVKKCRGLLPFTLVTGAVVVVIELSQFLFAAGFCDVDDLILNVSGAVITYWLLHRKPVRILVQKLTLLPY